MNLSEGEGTAFYEFPDIADEKAFKASTGNPWIGPRG
jgi:heme oxygenase (biliverdin-producing, ferredoxin)